MSTAGNADAQRSVVDDELTLVLLDPSHDEPRDNVVRADIDNVPDELR